MANFNGEIYTTAQAAKYLGFAEDTVRRYIYRKLIKAKKLGSQWLVTQDECNRYKTEKRERGNPGKKLSRKN